MASEKLGKLTGCIRICVILCHGAHVLYLQAVMKFIAAAFPPSSPVHHFFICRFTESQDFIYFASFHLSLLTPTCRNLYNDIIRFFAL